MTRMGQHGKTPALLRGSILAYGLLDVREVVGAVRRQHGASHRVEVIAVGAADRGVLPGTVDKHLSVDLAGFIDGDLNGHVLALP